MRNSASHAVALAGLVRSLASERASPKSVDRARKRQGCRDYPQAVPSSRKGFQRRQRFCLTGLSSWATQRKKSFPVRVDSLPRRGRRAVRRSV